MLGCTLLTQALPLLHASEPISEDGVIWKVYFRVPDGRSVKLLRVTSYCLSQATVCHSYDIDIIWYRFFQLENILTVYIFLPFYCSDFLFSVLIFLFCPFRFSSLSTPIPNLSLSIRLCIRVFQRRGNFNTRTLESCSVCSHLPLEIVKYLLACWVFSAWRVNVRVYNRLSALHATGNPVKELTALL